jgi:hypothetical protein
MKKWWVKLLLGLGAILLVLLVMLLSFSIHSKNSVDEYKDKLRAAGEKLDVNELIPPRPDPDKNGESFFNDACRSMNTRAGALESNTPSAVRMVAPGKAIVGWQQPEVMSPQYSGFVTNTWEDVELALQSQASTFDLIRQAAERPQLVFELDYKLGLQTPLPHLAKAKGAALLFSPAVVDALHRGDSGSAATNIHTMLALLNAWKEPFLISQLVRIAMAQIAMSDQWELLQSTKLSDEQLAILQRDWTDMDFVQSMENAFLMERVISCSGIQNLRGSNSPSSRFSGMSSSGGGGCSGDWLEDLKDLGRSAKRKTSETLWRASWSYSDELSILKGDQVLVEAVRQVQTNGYFKNALVERDRKLAALGLGAPGTNWLRDELDDEFPVIVADSVQELSRSFDRLLTMEAARHMAITSIALKRYQLRHAKSPPDLSALVPEFLPQVPRDPVDGHPLRYQVISDNSFLLYSIGKDGVDNGGDPTPGGKSKALQWLLGRDWVWPQPATPAEIQNFYDNPPK